MDFRTLNKFNLVVNTVSGNFLPLIDKSTEVDFVSSLWLIFSWLIHLTYFCATLIGLICYLPALDAVRTGGTVITICVEVFFLVSYLTYRREYLRNFIGQMNNILVDSEDLKQCINDTIEPHKKRLKLYAFMNLSSWLVWEAQPLAKIFQKDEFTYTDFRLTTYFPGAPFNAFFFVLGVVFRAFGGTYIMLKKIGVDVYINYIITLLTAEYRYLEARTAAALREKDESLVIEALKECVVIHCNTMKSGILLVDVLSINIGVSYFNCIFRFCCTAFMIVTLPESLPNKFINVFFGAGLLMQVYLLCSCIQDLLEASTSVATKAFYENWYEHSRTARRILHTIGLGNKMECRLNAFGIFDLTVPTLATILKQSYSACILLMRMQ